MENNKEICIFLFCLLFPVFSAYGDDCMSLNNKHTIKIIAYNIWMRPPFLFWFHDGQSTRAKLIASKIPSVDVIVFSEAFEKKARNMLIQMLKKKYPYSSKMLGKDKFLKINGGILILSRWPIREQHQRLYSKCSGSDCLSSKGVISAFIEKPGQTFQIFGTHLQADPTKKARKIRAYQLRELSIFVKRYRKKGVPYFVAGDLNVNFFSSEFKNVLQELGVHLPKLKGLSYTFDPQRNPLASGSKEYLDFVLYGKDFVPKKTPWQQAFLLRSDQPWRTGVWDLSDHDPVLACFRII